MIRIVYLDQNPYRAAAVKELLDKKVRMCHTTSLERTTEILQQHDDHFLVVHASQSLDLKPSDILDFRRQFADMFVLILTEETPAQILFDLWNRFQANGVLVFPAEKDQLLDVLQRNHRSFIRRRRQIQLNHRLLKANEQLEFILRERLIS